MKRLSVFITALLVGGLLNILPILVLWLIGQKWIFITLLEMLLFFVIYVLISYIKNAEQEYEMLNDLISEHYKEKEEL